MENKEQILKLINETYTENELKIFIGNVFSIIEILNKCKILINSEEFLSLFKHFYHAFQKLNSTILFKKVMVKEFIIILRDLFFSIFYQKYFFPQSLKSLSEIKNEPNRYRNLLKLTHLIIIFSILGGEYNYVRDLKSKSPVLNEDESLRMLFLLPEYKLSSTINYFSNKTDIPNNILNFQKLLQDTFNSYIFNYCLEIKYDSNFFCDSKPNENKIFHLEVFNHSDIAFKDVTLNLKVKPENRMDLKIIRNPNHEELDKRLEWEYELTRKMAGKVNFPIQLAVNDSYIKENILNYEKKLEVITILKK